MEMLYGWMPLIYTAIIGIGIFMYVWMDGFDLGVGILFNAAPTEEDRDILMNSIAPVWDGNETWLVLGGGALLVAFPMAYSILMPAFYIPLTIMLLGLIFRGVAFEFRFKATRAKRFWNLAFGIGSLTAAIAQGMVLGAYVGGIEVADGRFAGGAFDWVTPLAVVTGCAVACGYTLLGATWTAMKTEGALQDWAFAIARRMCLGVVIFMAVVSIGTAFTRREIADLWFSWPNVALLAPVPITAAIAAAMLVRAVMQRREIAPFVLTLVLFALGYLGLGISLWPTIIPPDIDIWQAAGDPGAQGFLLVGVVFLLPCILGYTALTYWIFRGKVRADGGYH
ncbi:MAG: cytochrome d ubiquinol oxidase subunit II [Rhodospirillales bacterium]